MYDPTSVSWGLSDTLRHVCRHTLPRMVLWGSIATLACIFAYAIFDRTHQGLRWVRRYAAACKAAP